MPCWTGIRVSVDVSKLDPQLLADAMMSLNLTLHGHKC